jgi:hypothetical protein
MAVRNVMLNVVCDVSGAGSARGRKFALCGVFIQETKTDIHSLQSAQTRRLSVATSREGRGGG